MEKSYYICPLVQVHPVCIHRLVRVKKTLHYSFVLRYAWHTFSNYCVNTDTHNIWLVYYIKKYILYSGKMAASASIGFNVSLLKSSPYDSVFYEIHYWVRIVFGNFLNVRNGSCISHESNPFYFFSIRIN